MNKYRKKPVVIEAVQWTGENTFEVKQFCKDSYETPSASTTTPNELVIITLEDGETNKAKHVASVGDYIIKGVEGEFYPCKPDIFNKTYDKEQVMTKDSNPWGNNQQKKKRAKEHNDWREMQSETRKKHSIKYWR